MAAANEAGCASLTEMDNPDMPVYPLDAEKAAWEHLLGLGLPRDYLFVYPADVKRLNSGGDVLAGFLTLKDSFYGGRLIASIGPARLAPRTAELPSRPDLLAKSGGVPVYEIFATDEAHEAALKRHTRKYFEAGIRLFRRGRTGEALRYFRAVLKLHPGDRAASFLASQCEARAGTN